jgi:hypothetical protein
VLPAQYLSELRGGLNAIFQREDECVGSNQGPDRFGSLGNLPCLHTDQDCVNGFDFGGIIRCDDRLDCKISVDTFNDESIRLQSVKVLTAGDECDSFTCFGQATTKITPGSTSPKYDNVHKRLPMSRYMILHYLYDNWMNDGMCHNSIKIG